MTKPLDQILSDHGYSHQLVEDVAKLGAADNPGLALRIALDSFFRETVARAPLLQGVPFLGDAKSFQKLRDFAVSRQWLTPEESSFVATFYGVLSESAHQTSALIEPGAAADVLRYIVLIVCFRIGHGTPRIPKPNSYSVGRHRLAKQFLRGVRNRDLRGPGFSAEFDEDLMALTRDMLNYSDAPLLFEIIANEAVSSGIRNRCASIIISPRSFRNHQERARMISSLWAYYQTHIESLPWEVARAIALALANRANFEECIIDYVERLDRDENAREANLLQTDRYYGGEEVAVERYLKRLADSKAPSTGNVWEVYYVSHRASPADKKIRELLLKRFKSIESPRLKVFWERMLKLGDAKHDSAG